MSPRFAGRLLPSVSSLFVLLLACCERDAPRGKLTDVLPSGLLDLGTSQQFAEIVTAIGLDGPEARIVAKHSRKTALNYCRALAAYEGRDPDDRAYLSPCIEAALSRQPQVHVASADCPRGVITVPWQVETAAPGPTYRLGGYDRTRHDYQWLDARTGAELTVGSATYHSSVGSNFEELCPSTVAALRNGSRTFATP